MKLICSLAGDKAARADRLWRNMDAAAEMAAGGWTDADIDAQLTLMPGGSIWVALEDWAEECPVLYTGCTADVIVTLMQTCPHRQWPKRGKSFIRKSKQWRQTVLPRRRLCCAWKGWRVRDQIRTIWLVHASLGDVNVLVWSVAQVAALVHGQTLLPSPRTVCGLYHRTVAYTVRATRVLLRGFLDTDYAE